MLQTGFSRYFRNNVGVARYTDEKGHKRVVRYGLANGSSDVIGWTTVRVTPEMVGRDVAIFTAIELKRGKDTLSEDQINFGRAVIAGGGIAMVASDHIDAGLRMKAEIQRITT